MTIYEICMKSIKSNYVQLVKNEKALSHKVKCTRERKYRKFIQRLLIYCSYYYVFILLVYVTSIDRYSKKAYRRMMNGLKYLIHF